MPESQSSVVMFRPSHQQPCTYVGKQLWNRDGTIVGIITGTSLCRLEGCRGTRLHVKWPDGKRTYPCAKGCRSRADRALQIV